MQRPNPFEYQEYYAEYINQLPYTNGIMALKETGTRLKNTLLNFPKTKGTYKYEIGKWSVNDLLLHLIDCEIVFVYRAMRIARGDKTEMPGFNQDDYVQEAKADYKNLDELIDLFDKTRQLTLGIFSSFNYTDEEKTGNANGGTVSLRALCYIIAGHTQHHTNILNERYL